MNRSNVRIVGALFGAAACVALAACDGTTSEPPPGGSELVLPVPEAVLQSRAIDVDALEVDVEIDGTPLQAERTGDEWVVSTTVFPGQRLRLEITWFERFRGSRLRLATSAESIGPFTGDTTFAVDAADYASDPYDDDDDGRSNLAERIAGTDPINGRDPGVEPPANGPQGPDGERIDVRVPKTDPPVRPRIDGFLGVQWERAVATDVNGASLAIDNLVFEDDGAEAGDGEVPYRWLVSHDSEFLYLFVVFEPAGSRTPRRDSPSIEDDDALRLFFDGDLSRGEELDGVNGDDRYIVLPQLPAVGEREPVAMAGDPARAPVLPPSLEYNSGYQGWEIKIALDDLDIRVGRPFGFEVQIDQDTDGGSLDARWAWAAPSPADRPDDFEFESPRFNGTVLLTE